eukprot:1257405-Amphidinium_carterae.1
MEGYHAFQSTARRRPATAAQHPTGRSTCYKWESVCFGGQLFLRLKTENLWGLKFETPLVICYVQ